MSVLACPFPSAAPVSLTLFLASRLTSAVVRPPQTH
jgi:hypothetical protein